jgi:signal transduction histidine kinase/ActR/RegA family two-component response regulator
MNVAVSGSGSTGSTAREAREPFEHLRSIVDALPVGVVLLARDDDGRVTTLAANAAYAELVGEQPSPGSTLQGLPFGFYRADRHCPLPRPELPGFRAMAGQTVRNEELHVRRADGTWRVVVSGAAPVRHGERVVGAVVVCQDITPLNEMEEALRRREQELRERDRRKEQFLAVLSHELRNPLAAIANAAHVLRQRLGRGLDSERPLAILDRQVRNATRILDDLLDLSRITHGKIQLRRERVRLDALVTSAVQANRAVGGQGEPALSVELPPSPVFVEADPTRIEQVVANLVGNAVKHTPAAGHIRVSVDVREGRARVRVADDGAGIEPELLPRVFEPFVQGDTSIGRARGGLGIGLTLVRDLVALHGGTVGVQSDGPGRGSEFAFELPSVRGEPVVPERAPQPEAAAPSAARKVLVVEDNPDVAETLAEFLRTLGHEVRVAPDGPAALGAVDEGAPDVVLLDIGLPGIDGYEVARRLRASAGGDRLFLVGLTGYGQAEDRARSSAAGFDLHLTKPIDLEVVGRLVAAAARG